MSSTPITESYFIIVAVIAATVLTAAIIPSIATVSNVYTQQAQNFQDKGNLQVTIIFAEGVSGSKTATIWLKNTGISSLPSSLINQSELFFGPTGAFSRIQYNSTGGIGWHYTIVNDINHNGILDPGETLQITVTLQSSLSSGDYYVRFVTYLGTYSEYSFSM